MEGIVIGIDESPGSTTALRWALREAAARGWPPVTAVLGWGTLDRHCVVLGERFERGYDLQDADDALLAVIEAAVGVKAARRISRRVACGDGASALLDAAVGADLLVVGARGGGGFHDLRLGSVAEQCLHHAPCPVAVVRPAAGAGTGGDGTDTGVAEADVPPLGRVLVGVDGSEGAQRALHWAIDEARTHGAVLEVLHVWRPPTTIGEPVDVLPADPLDVDAGDKAARHLVDTALAREDLAGLTDSPTVHVTHGPPAATVLQAAHRADLVVLGARGRGGFPGLRLGAVGHQVARHAPCPVVVVPPPDR